MRVRFLLLAVAFSVIALSILTSPQAHGATIWPATTVPGTVDSGPDSAVELGIKFRSDTGGFVTGIRFYKASTNTGTHVANLWSASGARLATATFANETASGWQQVNFATPVAITANTVYVASYHTNSGHYSDNENFFLGKGVDAPPLHVPADGVSGVNGVYAYGSGSSFPRLGWRSSNYWVDVVFSAAPPPTVTLSSIAVTPVSQTITRGTTRQYTATGTFSDGSQQNLTAQTTWVSSSTAVATISSSGLATAVNSGSTTISATLNGITGSTTLSVQAAVLAITTTALAGGTPNVPYSATLAASGGTLPYRWSIGSGSLPAGLALNSSTGVISGTPTATGAFSFTVLAADSSNPALNANKVLTITIAVSASVTIWPATAVPGIVDSGPDSSVELGVKFRSDTSGSVTGIRFYKATANTGTHTGRLWSVTGTLLASATFSNETASGWQQVNFATPVAISANTVYVASYHTNSGHYSDDLNFFSGKGVDAPPLHALANGVSGFNGVYAYGTASSFPNQGWNSSNYWVDVVFNAAPSSDTTLPIVNAFTIPATASTLSVAITSFTATDNAGVTGYLVNESATKPAAGDSGWSSSVPGSYTFASAGSKTLYAWARDAAGNVSDSRSAAVTITLAPVSADPILVITSASNPFTGYYAEILRAEGLNNFTETDISALSPGELAIHDVAVLGEMPLNASQVTMLNNWVNGGGKLIAMRPDKKLAALLGVTDLGSTMSNAYLLVNTSFGPGVGIVDQTIQFHGTADRYALNGATSLATLYSSATATTSNPAATLQNVGTNGGQAAAFTYDLARSVVYTRQGNPNWSGQERDSFAPIRSDDLYYGAAAFDPQTDWVDLDKVAIPQADEQQRMLANLIIRMAQDKKPLPRFWYFPRGLQAVVVMTADDHGNNGTAGRFDSYLAASPPNCSVDNWECIRGTSYIYTTTPLSNTQAAAYNNAGFEVGLHVFTNCADWSTASLESFYTTQLSAWAAKYGSLPAPTTNRTHCIVWSDYVTQSKVELAHGIRLDANYYYWPSNWVNDNPGFFTGSGMPMRFADSSGNLIDVYQATTQMTDESGQTYPATINTLLDRAIGPQGFYGAFVVNAHTDQTTSSVSDAVIGSAKARGIPVVSARQLLTWLDGRNDSTFNALAWNGSVLTFSISAAQGAIGLVAMLPMLTGQAVTAVTRNGSAVSFASATVKGIPYASFSAASGTYQVTYGSGSPPPPPPPPGSTGPFSLWSASTVPGVIDSGPDSAVELGVKFRSDTSGFITGIRFYKASSNTGTHVGSLWTTTGTRLATATFTNETSSGWQQVDFPTPVAVSANTVYVASYHTSTGHYSYNSSYFAGSGVDSPPLHAPANGVSGFNGVYAYGAAGSFPTQGWNSSNYWVDVVFTTSAQQVQAPILKTLQLTLPSPPATLLSITVTPGNQRIAIGTTQQFTATGTYSDGSTQNLNSQVTWSTSDINVVAVSTTGLVTAFNSGTATITVTLNGITGSTGLTATDGVASLSSDHLAMLTYESQGGFP